MRRLFREFRSGERRAQAFADFWRREQLSVLLMALTLLVAWLATVTVLHGSEESAVCRSVTRIAAIESRSLAAAQQRARAVLPRANIPGLSHDELIRLTREGEVREDRRIAELDLVARRSCGR